MSIFSVKWHHCFLAYGTIHLRRRHFLGGRAQNLLNLPMNSSKKLPTEGGKQASKIMKICRRLAWMVYDIISSFFIFCHPTISCLNFPKSSMKSYKKQWGIYKNQCGISNSITKTICCIFLLFSMQPHCCPQRQTTKKWVQRMKKLQS